MLGAVGCGTSSEVRARLVTPASLLKSQQICGRHLPQNRSRVPAWWCGAGPSVLRALGEEQSTGRVTRGWGTGCMLLTGTAVAVRRGGGVAVVRPLVLTVVAVIAALSVSRRLCLPRLKSAAGWAC